MVLAEKIEPDSPDPRLKSLTTGKGGKETVFDPSKAEMLILQLRFKRYVLLDAFVGYLHRGGLLLPLGEIVRAVDFAINVNPAAGQAEGWFLRENRRFALDVPAGEVVVEGKKKSLPSALVSVQPE
ncbi:MAG: hypothetical protein GWO19_12600, partial [Nitrospinaceae bacterium]|nr:hypothetical protein [Nitrospinaceae bacterium]